MKIPVWIAMWNFLDERQKKGVTSYNSVAMIIRGSGVSLAPGHNNIKFLEDMGLINIIRNKPNNRVVLTQKFLETSDTLREVYESYSIGV